MQHVKTAKVTSIAIIMIMIIVVAVKVDLMITITVRTILVRLIIMMNYCEKNKVIAIMWITVNSNFASTRIAIV